MSNKLLNIEPVALGAAAANLLNCALGSVAGPVGFTMTQPYVILSHIRITNNDSVAHVAKLFKGATGGSAVGTEFAFAGTSIAANSYLDWYGKARFDSGDFLTGLADAANKLTVEIDGEIGVS